MTINSVTDVYTELRPLLFSIAYRMLSSVADAEDVVQESFLRFHAADAEIESPKAYLSRGDDPPVHRSPAFGAGAAGELRR